MISRLLPVALVSIIFAACDSSSSTSSTSSTDTTYSATTAMVREKVDSLSVGDTLAYYEVSWDDTYFLNVYDTTWCYSIAKFPSGKYWYGLEQIRYSNNSTLKIILRQSWVDSTSSDSIAASLMAKTIQTYKGFIDTSYKPRFYRAQ